MMPSRSCNGVRPDADRYCGKVFEIFLTTFFSNGEGMPYGWLPMGSPGPFIHSGTLGGRLLVSPAAASDLPATPPANATPPMMAAPRRRWRRDVLIKSFRASSDLGISILFLCCQHQAAMRRGKHR